MVTTQMGLCEYFCKIGFRKVTYSEGWYAAEVTLSGFGRLRRPKEKELAEIRNSKPIFLSLTLTRKVFGFRLWKIDV